MASVTFFLDRPYKDDLTASEKKKIEECRASSKPIPLPLLNPRDVSVWASISFGNYKRVRIKTEEKINPKHWDFDLQFIKKGTANYLELSTSLTSVKSKLLDRYREKSKDQSITLDKLKDDFHKVVNNVELHSSVNFSDAFAEFLASQNEVLASNTIKKYKTTIQTLDHFALLTGFRLDFSNIDHKFYDAFVRYLLNRPNPLKKDNPEGLLNDSIAKYISCIKRFMQWASDRGYHKNFAYKQFKKGAKSKHQIVSLTLEEMKKLYEVDLSKSPRLEKVRDVFVFAVHTGQRWSDVENFNKKQVTSKYWSFMSVKTRKNVTIPLAGFSERALSVLKKYNYELPVITPQKFNEYLKEVGEKAKINAPVIIERYSGNRKIIIEKPKYEFMASHMARRTCVTLLLEMGVPPTTIMKLTGHTDLKTLMKYENTDQAELERALKMISI